MVAAAFIGPGTITTATRAGGSVGYALLWAVAFSTLACLGLQEMSARLGVVGQLGVGAALRQKLTHPVLKWPVLGLVLGAVLVGNAAYEGGNLAGGQLGLEALVPGMNQWWPAEGERGRPVAAWVVAALAAALLWTGRYRWIETALVGMVALMGLVFLTAAVAADPDWTQVARGLLIPRMPADHLSMVLGLIGTTVVPYNLFLHASAARQRWQDERDLSAARLDTVLSVSLGGLITAAILVAAATVAQQQAVPESAADLSQSLRSLLGDGAPWFLGLGILAAGLSSSITAPLAAAFATGEVFGDQGTVRQPLQRVVWAAVILAGVVVATSGAKPTAVILFAQVANGLLLPIVATFLVWVMNDRSLLGDRVNTWRSNLVAAVVILVTLGLSIRMLARALGWME